MKLQLLSLALCSLLLGACATAPRKYAPPDSTKLRASTERVRKAVDAAHESARKAQASVKTAAQQLKAVRAETAKIKDLPAAVTEKIDTLEASITQAQTDQVLLENHLNEADKAKADVEKDKTDYFANAQKLADAASKENTAAVSAEKKLSWYRWHFWLSWIVAGAGVLVCIFIAFLKFTGRLAASGAVIASRVP